MPAAYRYVLADVFTDRPLTGNQLAVFTDARGMPEDQMQAIARELNLSETVFVLPAEGEGHARIRIFTPGAELAFAGHPTLGAAFVLAAPLELPELHLETGAGVVPVRVTREGGRVSFGWMAQPVPSWKPYAAAGELLAALGGVEAAAPVELYDNGMRHALVRLGSAEEVAVLAPDLVRLGALPDALGFCCFAGAGRAWKARVFLPAVGIPEDPATGSAAGPIAVAAARAGLTAWGDEIEILQGEEIRRPSRLLARAEGEGERVQRVEVGGSAVIIARGELRL